LLSLLLLLLLITLAAITITLLPLPSLLPATLIGIAIAHIIAIAV
jgi:hypothetical protein